MNRKQQPTTSEFFFDEEYHACNAAGNVISDVVKEGGAYSYFAKNQPSATAQIYPSVSHMFVVCAGRCSRQEPPLQRRATSLHAAAVLPNLCLQSK